jgi:predicted nucleic acid-binding protein
MDFQTACFPLFHSAADIYGEIQLFGPNGALLRENNDYYDDLIAYTATNSGTFTVLVSSAAVDGVGTYVLNLAQMPEPFIVPAGEQGGPLTNGAAATGTNTLGGQQMWTFTANKGDSINVRLGTTGFYGEIQLFGPNGALLSEANDYYDDLIAYTATNSGTFTVLVSSAATDGVGTYVLNLAQIPEPFIVPSGGSGGAMAGSANYAGTITLGDQDMFSFTACTGDSIDLGLKTTNFNGYIELYGSNGALLKSDGGSTVLSIAYTATNCGTFTILVSAYSSGGTGTYGLTDNGLEDTMRVCFPVISGASLTVNGVGGPINARFVLYSATNIATPFRLWTPVFTNQFNQFGVFIYTNGYNPAPPQKFFRFVLP